MLMTYKIGDEMKLIDLIVKEVKREDIPEDTLWIMQDRDGEIKTSDIHKTPVLDEDQWVRGLECAGESLGFFETSSDYCSQPIRIGIIMAAYDAAEKLAEPEKLIDEVNHPSHYTIGKIECIDIIEEMVRDKPGMEAACIANVVKYLYRYKGKGGLESVKKAQWYLNKMVEVMENE